MLGAHKEALDFIKD